MTMTSVTASPAAPVTGLPRTAIRLPTGPAPAVVPITRGTGAGTRTLGVVLLDRGGCRWQRTGDLDRLVAVATLTCGAVAAIGLAAQAVGRPRVQQITMGPGGWVSFRGGSRPRPHGPRRPWWAVLLRARPLDR